MAFEGFDTHGILIASFQVSVDDAKSGSRAASNQKYHAAKRTRRRAAGLNESWISRCDSGTSGLASRSLDLLRFGSMHCSASVLPMIRCSPGLYMRVADGTSGSRKRGPSLDKRN